MAATPQDIQTKLATALAELKQATSSPAKVVRDYGPDPAKWPNGHLKNSALGILAASAEAGQLAQPVTAAFNYTKAP